MRILTAQRELASREGSSASPLRPLRSRGSRRRSRRAGSRARPSCVVVLTGHGLKDPETAASARLGEGIRTCLPTSTRCATRCFGSRTPDRPIDLHRERDRVNARGRELAGPALPDSQVRRDVGLRGRRRRRDPRAGGAAALALARARSWWSPRSRARPTRCWAPRAPRRAATWRAGSRQIRAAQHAAARPRCWVSDARGRCGAGDRPRRARAAAPGRSALLGECPPKTLDSVLSFGERMSVGRDRRRAARSAAWTRTPATRARFIVTDDRFGEARVDFAATGAAARARFAAAPGRPDRDRLHRRDPARRDHHAGPRRVRLHGGHAGRRARRRRGRDLDRRARRDERRPARRAGRVPARRS